MTPRQRLIGLNGDSPVNQRAKTLAHELSHMLIHGDEAGGSDEVRRGEADRGGRCLHGDHELRPYTSHFSIPHLASWSERAPLETIERAARRIEDAVLLHRLTDSPT